MLIDFNQFYDTYFENTTQQSANFWLKMVKKFWLEHVTFYM